ncbi:MAG TPA: hypothetical protein VM489_10655 [Burkholderiales bacterium]|nr:hypothetical protein [Burkholderiales bacterium]
MKRLIAAVSLAVLAAPAFASPFEQNQLDRALPTIDSRVDGAAAGGSYAESVWADNHAFVSPAQ